MRPTRPWPLLADGAGFLLIGAASAWGKLADRELSYALAAAGLITLGVWIATEVTRLARDESGEAGAPSETPTPPDSET